VQAFTSLTEWHSKRRFNLRVRDRTVRKALVMEQKLINVQQTKNQGEGTRWSCLVLTHTTAAKICQYILPYHANNQDLLTRVLWTSGSLYRHEFRVEVKKKKRKRTRKKVCEACRWYFFFSYNT
jgi:hypothetical protein